VKWTYDDLRRLPYDGKRHEIIDGVHYVSDAHYTRWQRVVARLKCLLQLRDNFFYRQRGSRTTIMGARHLMIEIVTDFTAQFDEAAALAEHDDAGFAEFWVLVPKKKTIRVYRRIDERLTSVAVPDPITTPLLPDFQLRIADLFA
jgi:Uma2 family endonuclease